MNLEQGGFWSKSLEEIFVEFEAAEKAIKSAETCESEISLTAVNQVRYAFKHLSDAFDAYQRGDHEQAKKDLSKSRGHCRRSYYDACDAEITYCLSEINNFISACHAKELVISDVVDGYSDRKAIVLKAQRFLEEDQYEIDDKSERYKVAGSIRDSLRSNFFDHLPGFYDIANGLVDVNRRRKLAEIKSLRLAKVTLLVSAFAIIVSVLVVAFDSSIKSFGSDLLKKVNPEKT